MASWFRDRIQFRRAAIGFLLAVITACIWWQREAILIWVYYAPIGRTELPPFDAEKAAGLSPERRTQLERELFAEVYLWNTDSRRYNGPDALNQREQRWREMADEGFELAYLTLTAFEPSAVRKHSPLPALRRLIELARQGDAGAMCLIPNIVLRLPSWGSIEWSRYQEQARFWMQKGADAGHPECMTWMGGRLLFGSDGFARNVPRGMDLLSRALHGGYMRAAGTIGHYFDTEYGLGDVRNRRRVYCWDYQGAKNDFHDPDLSIRVYRNQARPKQREELDREIQELRSWHPTVKECFDLSQQTSGG
jgi:hypothetical protein